MRNFGIALTSIVLTTLVIGNAFYQKTQFYPSVVYITKSNPSMAVLYIQALILVFLMGKLMRKVFFGQLRAAEFEHLMERSWYAVTETCLAFTVFRDDFSPKFVALFTLLLFLKSFHWLAEDRVDYMERSPVISWLFHLRVLSLLTLLGALDLHFVGHAYQSTVTKGASVQLVFGFEYAILLTVMVNIAIKYVLHTVDLHSDSPWENKAILLLYTELIMGFLKVILYVTFVAIMVRIYTLPLFAFRPMYYTLRSFKKAFNDVILSRRAIRNMNTLYPDATTEELVAADNVCIICREEMLTASKKLPCNHIFHTACLRSWFQRQQTCPTCRLNILRTPAPATPATPPPPQQPAPPPPAAHPAAAFPFHWPPPPPPTIQQPGVAVNTSGDGGSTAASNAGTMPPMANFPFFCPPFPFMPPFNIPPPMPPADLLSLSEEELRRMESATREGVEARLRCLRHIQLMLDSSVMMMQQYSAAAAAGTSFPSDHSSTSSGIVNSGDGSTKAGTILDTAVPLENKEQTSMANKSIASHHPSTSSEVGCDRSSKPTTSQNMILQPECTANNGDAVEDTGNQEKEGMVARPVLTTEQEEARKRRLAKFASTSMAARDDPPAASMH